MITKTKREYTKNAKKTEAQKAAEAQKALDALPPELKSGASVKNWGSVQR